MITNVLPPFFMVQSVHSNEVSFIKIHQSHLFAPMQTDNDAVCISRRKTDRGIKTSLTSRCVSPACGAGAAVADSQ